MPSYDVSDIFWYSGTGNSYAIAEEIAKSLKDKGIEVNLVQINDFIEPKIISGHLIGLVFPVAVQGTYPFIWRFFHRLPVADNDIFMADTLHAYSGGIKGPLKKLLLKKGYSPLSAIEIAMPGNFPPGVAKPSNYDEKITKGLLLAREFVEKTLSKKACWRDIPLLSDLMGIMCRTKQPWRFMRKQFGIHVDSKKCVGCGYCLEFCPVKNFVINDFGKAEAKNLCETCMRCLAYCPSDAILTKKGKKQQIKTSDFVDIMKKNKKM